MKLFANLELRLADDWRRLHTRGTVIFSAVMGFVSAFGPELRKAWDSMPADLKAIVPDSVQKAIAYAVLFSVLIGIRYTSIRRVSTPEASDAAN